MLQPQFEKRLEKVKPILDEMFAYLESITVSSSCDLGKAVNYALNEKKYLYTFLESGEIPIDNNRAENAIRRLDISELILGSRYFRNSLIVSVP